MSDREGVFHFSFEEWGGAWGQLTPCECCGSFGRVSVRNRAGQEFMQLCAMAGSELASWGAFLDAAASGGIRETADAARAGEAANESIASWVAGLPRIPGDSEWVGADAGDLAGIIAVLQHEKLPVRWTLRGAEFCHTRVFAPEAHELAGGGRVLSVRGPAAETIQLGVPMVRALAVGSRASDCPLHVAGPDNARLLTLSAADGREEAALWRVIMRNYFPEITGA